MKLPEQQGARWVYAVILMASVAATNPEAGHFNRAATMQVLQIEDQSGRQLEIDLPLGEWLSDALELTYDQQWLNARGVEMRRTNCRHSVDKLQLLRNAQGILARFRLSAGYSSVSGEHILLFSRPTRRNNSAVFYTYLAEVPKCSLVCRLRVAAHRVEAPVENGRILLSRAAKSDDDIAGELVDAADPVFQRCT